MHLNLFALSKGVPPSLKTLSKADWTEILITSSTGGFDAQECIFLINKYNNNEHSVSLANQHFKYAELQLLTLDSSF